MLLRVALATLRDPATPQGLLGAAVACLSQAAQDGYELPTGSAEALWNSLRQHPETRWASLASEALGQLADAGLVATVVATIRDHDVGADLARAALDALAGAGAAGHINDLDLLDVSARALGNTTYQAETLVRAVSGHRRVHRNVLGAIAEEWFRRRERSGKLAALGVVDLLPKAAAQNLIERALSDSLADVRTAAATIVPDFFGRAEGLALVQLCITIEHHISVHTELLRAKADLLKKPLDAR